MFSKYGPIADVSIVYDQQSRRSRGFAFVYFENVEDAKEVSWNMYDLEHLPFSAAEMFLYSALQNYGSFSCA